MGLDGVDTRQTCYVRQEGRSTCGTQLAAKWDRFTGEELQVKFSGGFS
jgi:hypothetical protein